MMPRPVTPARLLVTVIASALAAVACSSGGGTAGAGGPASAGGAAPAALSPARALTLAADQAKQATSFTATMDISSAGTDTSHITGTLTEQTKPSVLADQKFAVTSNGTAIPGGMETLLTSSAIYLRMSSLSRMTGKPWIRMPFSSLESSLGTSLAPLIHQMEGNNPLAFTQMLPAASDLRQVGSQTINGTATTEYTGTLDVAKALTRLDPSLKNLMQPMLAATGLTTDQFHVWVDGQHQVRKLSQLESGKNYQVTSVMTVTSINQPVNIQVPPASQTASLPGM